MDDFQLESFVYVFFTIEMKVGALIRKKKIIGQMNNSHHCIVYLLSSLLNED
jgi:hypothetical protein